MTEGFGTDSASVNVGKKKGVAARLSRVSTVSTTAFNIPRNWIVLPTTYAASLNVSFH